MKPAEKTPGRSRRNTIYNEAWVEAVKGLCLEGIPLSQMSRMLAERGLQSGDTWTVSKYISSGLIPDVTRESYMDARRARQENTRRNRARPLPRVWDTAVGRLMAEGWPLAAISEEVKRRGLKPSSTYAIAKRLAVGQISGQSKERYEAAKQARKARLFTQWCEIVRPLLLSGCSGRCGDGSGYWANSQAAVQGGPFGRRLGMVLGLLNWPD